jgi:hypothetical protein
VYCKATMQVLPIKECSRGRRRIGVFVTRSRLKKAGPGCCPRNGIRSKERISAHTGGQRAREVPESALDSISGPKTVRFASLYKPARFVARMPSQEWLLCTQP